MVYIKGVSVKTCPRNSIHDVCIGIAWRKIGCVSGNDLLIRLHSQLFVELCCSCRKNSSDNAIRPPDIASILSVVLKVVYLNLEMASSITTRLVRVRSDHLMCVEKKE